MIDGVHQAAAQFIAFWEGFISTARWDVNGYRLGFGSDTEGPEQTKVTRGMTTTRERALQNLVARVPQFEAVVKRQLGDGVYGGLPSSMKVSFLDLAYNYGDLPESVVLATGRGVSAAIAAVEAREGDDHRINAQRRRAEAALIASGL